MAQSPAPIHIVNPDQRDGHLARSSSAGIDTAGAQQNGQLEVRGNDDMYLRDGRFDAGRIVYRVDWAIQERSYIEDLIEFESRVNDVWLRHDDTVTGEVLERIP